MTTRPVRRACSASGTRIANLYSGHGTYSTLGLAHTDAGAADRLLSHWLMPQVDTAAELGAGMGFFTHAFPLAVLDDPAAYRRARGELVRRLAALVRYAADRLGRPLGLEQMYTPHQIPWTRTVRAVCSARSGRQPWLGAAGAEEILEAYCGGLVSEAGSWRRLDAYASERPYLYASDGDDDPYAWLRELGPYAPIVHLQQTDGHSSRHLPFTAHHNKTGIISPPAVLAALAEGFRDISGSGAPPGGIPPVEEIFLTLEIFLGTASHPYAALEEIRESVRYWRQSIPEDGLDLGELAAAGDARGPTS